MSLQNLLEKHILRLSLDTMTQASELRPFLMLACNPSTLEMEAGRSENVAFFFFFARNEFETSQVIESLSQNSPLGDSGTCSSFRLFSTGHGNPVPLR